MFNDRIRGLINELTFEQNKNFCFSCINRLKHLPHLFINTDNEGMNYLNEIFLGKDIENIINDMVNKLSKIFLDDDIEEMDKNIKLFKRVLLDDEETYNSTEENIFFYYVNIIIHLFEYIKEKNCKSIYWCSNAIIEIISQIKYDEYCKINKNGKEKEALEYVDMEIEYEIDRQMEIIELLKENDEKKLNDYIENNRIEYNG
jgi:hypothetical protein